MSLPRALARLIASILVAGATLAGPPAVSAETAVTIRIGSTLDPATVTVPPGTRVTWLNRDDDRHRVRSRSGPVEFDSGNIDPGGSFSVTLSAAGSYAYVDDRERDDVAYHGTVIVAAASVIAPPGGGGGTPPAGGTTPSGASTTPTTATIGMAGRAFSPSTVRIAAGGTVTWRNDDDDDHTVTARAGAFDSGTVAPGASYRRTFAGAGTYAFLCAFHSEMSGTVEVVGQGATAAPPAATPKPPAPAPTTRPPAPSPAGSAGSTGEPSAVDAAIVDFAFEPAEVRIGAGGTVTWTKRGVAPHSVTATDGSFDSGFLDAAGTFRQTFATPGTFTYLCSVHPDMTGQVVVVAAGEGGAPGTSPLTTPTATPGPSASPPGSATEPGGSGSDGDDDATDAPADDARAADRSPVNLGGAALSAAGITIGIGVFAQVLRGVARRS